MGESPAEGGLQDAPERCGGTSGPAGSRILQSAVPCGEGDGGRGWRPVINLSTLKEIRHSDEVQYGDGCVCSWVDSIGGLDVLH